MQPLSQAEKAYLQEWLEVADLDLRAAERMLADDPAAYGYHLPFACQQAVEKYCKGVLLAQGNSFPRGHDLPELLNRLKPLFSFSAAELDDAENWPIIRSKPATRRIHASRLPKCRKRFGLPGTFKPGCGHSSTPLLSNESPLVQRF